MHVETLCTQVQIYTFPILLEQKPSKMLLDRFDQPEVSLECLNEFYVYVKPKIISGKA
jgi:hypothetical protein